MARRKTRRRRKRNSRKRKPFIPRLLGNSQLTRMRYATTFQLNPAAGDITSHVFRANGITQVDTTGTTGQPTGFDQFLEFFEQYKVLGSKITMEWVPTSVSNGTPGVYGVFTDDDASLTYGGYTDLLMGNESRTKNVRLAGIVAGDAKMMKTSSSYSSKRRYKQAGANELDLYGSSSAGPLVSTFYQCWYASPDGTADPVASNFLVVIDYVVLWIDKKFTVASTA